MNQLMAQITEVSLHHSFTLLDYRFRGEFPNMPYSNVIELFLYYYYHYFYYYQYSHHVHVWKANIFCHSSFSNAILRGHQTKLHQILPHVRKSARFEKQRPNFRVPPWNIRPKTAYFWVVLQRHHNLSKISLEWNELLTKWKKKIL